MKRLLTVLLLAIGWSAFPAEVIPPAPALYFNDYANVVSSATSQQLNDRLAQFERESSSQIVVAIFSKMQSDSSIEDYTVRVAQSWKVGQKDKDNGAVLFVFIQDRKMFLQVGYGLEGVLPDAICKRIIADEITPRFRNQDFDGGLSAGVTAILTATKGEYKGSGRTVADGRSSGGRRRNSGASGIFWLFLLAIVIGPLLFSRSRRGFFYTSGGWGSSGGGWSGGGGGGFSGGGGSFGGGGAGGSW